MTLMEAFTERPSAEAWAFTLHHSGFFLMTVAAALFVLCCGWWFEHLETRTNEAGVECSRSGTPCPLWLKSLIVITAVAGVAAIVASDFICMGRCDFYEHCDGRERRR